MDYKTALEFLLTLPDWERGPGARPAREELLLERPGALLAALGNPQRKYRSVLVAGTKGKGSTAAMLESILRAGGVRTGLYTSPHLHSYRERIRVNGRMIPPEEFARRVEELAPHMNDLLRAQPQLEAFTTFECMTALAFRHFAQANVEIAIVEVGLGGRLDATNVLDADLAIITPISLEHTRVLGDTLPQIAREKAGIIKPGKVILSAPQHPSVREVIERAAEKKNAPLGNGERDWVWLGRHDKLTVAGIPRAGVWDTYWRHQELRVPLLGLHQLENAATAVAGVHALGATLGLEISGDAVRRGLAAIQWYGRLEVLQARDENHCLIVADGAHNGESADKLAAALKFHFKFAKLWLVLGVLADKDLAGIVLPFVPLTTRAWAVQTNHPRSRPAREVAEVMRQLGIEAEAVPSVGEGLKRAVQYAAPNDLICVTGSLTVVAEAREGLGVQGGDFDSGPET